MVKRIAMGALLALSGCLGLQGWTLDQCDGGAPNGATCVATGGASGGTTTGGASTTSGTAATSTSGSASSSGSTTSTTSGAATSSSGSASSSGSESSTSGSTTSTTSGATSSGGTTTSGSISSSSGETSTSGSTSGTVTTSSSSSGSSTSGGEPACLPSLAAGPGGLGEIVSSATILGGWDPSCMHIDLAQDGGVSLAAGTDDGGNYAFSTLPPGQYSLTLQKAVTLPASAGFLAADGGPAVLTYSATIPEVDVANGSSTLFDLDASYPVAPIALPAGQQLLEAGPGTMLYPSTDRSHLLAWIVDGTGIDSNGNPVTYYTGESIPLDGGPVRVLATGVAGGQPNANDTVSADGTAFVSYPPSYMVVGSGVGSFSYSFYPVTWVSSDGGGGTVPWAWQVLPSPDGRDLAYVDDAGVEMLDFETGGTHQVAAAGLSEFQANHRLYPQAHLDQFAPAGNYIVFEEAIGGQTRLWVAPTTAGTATLLSSAYDSNQGMGFSPDGSHLAFDNLDDLCFGGYGDDLEAASVSGGSPVQIQRCSPGAALNGTGGAFSPDGKMLLICGEQDDGGNYPIDLASTANGAITSLGSHEICPLAGLYGFSPDSSEIAFYASWNNSGGAGPLVLASTSGGSLTQLGAASGFWFQGSELAFVTDASDGGGTLEFVSGSAPIPVATGVAPFFSPFSPDGRELAFLTNFDPSSNAGTLMIAPTNTGVPQTIATNVGNFQFSPDSSRLLFGRNLNQQTGIGDLELVPVSGGSPAVVGTNAATGYFSPDGRYVIALTDCSAPCPSPPSCPPPICSLAVMPVASSGPATAINENVTAFSVVPFPDGHLASIRSGSAPPFKFMDGVYLAPLP